MSTIDKRFYKNQVALNVLANSIENAKDVFDAAEGNILIGILSKNYNSLETAVGAMEEYGQGIDNAVSIGLGGGDNRQATFVSEIVKHYAGNHINQVFPEVSATRANLESHNGWINSLVSPSGRVGYVNISTGPISSNSKELAIVPIKAAINLIRDMGGNAVKYFPMKGLAYEEEYKAVAKACGEMNFGLEPTGGIDLDNFEKILDIALKAKVPKIIPHVYSSIIDKETGETRKADVKYLFEIVKRNVEKSNN